MIIAFLKYKKETTVREGIIIISFFILSSIFLNLLNFDKALIISTGLTFIAMILVKLFHFLREKEDI